MSTIKEIHSLGVTEKRDVEQAHFPLATMTGQWLTRTFLKVQVPGPSSAESELGPSSLSSRTTDLHRPCQPLSLDSWNKYLTSDGCEN